MLSVIAGVIAFSGVVWFGVRYLRLRDDRNGLKEELQIEKRTNIELRKKSYEFGELMLNTGDLAMNKRGYVPLAYRKAILRAGKSLKQMAGFVMTKKEIETGAGSKWTVTAARCRQLEQEGGA